MYKFTFFLSAAILSILSYSQQPSLCNENTLEVLTWNVEWFGFDHEVPKNDKGPDDEQLQMSNVIAILDTLGYPDIIVFQEICDRPMFKKMAGELNYDYYLSPGSNKYQKVGIFYHKKLEVLTAPKQILISDKHQFAQRPPVFAEFKHENLGEVSIIGMHLKAHRPRDPEVKKQDSWERRKRASELVQKYIADSLVDKQVIALGDWNDDIDLSNYEPNPTPFSSLLNDTTGRFVTEYLSLTYNESSKYGSVIDHIYVTDDLFDNFVYSGIIAVKELQRSFLKETSDHYPVYVVLR